VKTSSISAAFGTAALLAAITTPAFADQTNGSIDQTNGNSGAVVLVNPAATLAGNVLSAASGNIGANVASGVGNQQANFTQIHTNNGTSYPYGYGNSKSVTIDQTTGNISGVSVNGAVTTLGSDTKFVNNLTQNSSIGTTSSFKTTVGSTGMASTSASGDSSSMSSASENAAANYAASATYDAKAASTAMNMKNASSSSNASASETLNENLAQSAYANKSGSDSTSASQNASGSFKAALNGSGSGYGEYYYKSSASKTSNSSTGKGYA